MSKRLTNHDYEVTEASAALIPVMRQQGLTTIDFGTVGKSVEPTFDADWVGIA